MVWLIVYLWLVGAYFAEYYFWLEGDSDTWWKSLLLIFIWPVTLPYLLVKLVVDIFKGLG